MQKTQRGSPVRRGQQILIHRTYQSFRDQNIQHEQAIQATAAQLQFSDKTIRKYVKRVADSISESKQTSQIKNIS